jgi:hypothetical protein
MDFQCRCRTANPGMDLTQMPRKTSASKVHICKGKNRKFVRSCPDCWEVRLKLMHLTMDRAMKIGSGEIIYGQDVAVLDFFDAGSRYELASELGERTELD